MHNSVNLACSSSAGHIHKRGDERMKRMLSVLAALLLLPLPKMAAEPLRDNDL